MKPYPAYKNSDIEWLGEIPKHWGIMKNKYIFKKGKNIYNDSNDTTVLSLTTKGVKVKKDLTFGKSTESYIGHQLVKAGQIVFTPRDFDQTPILSGVSQNDGCISNLYFVLDCEDDIWNFFVNYFWWGLKYKVNFFKNFSHGMRFSFNQLQFDEILFLKPPIIEQQAIADFLDKKTALIDTLIEKKKRQIDLLKEQRQAVINRAVTKGLDPNVEMKDSGVEWLGEIPKHWGVKRLKFLGKAILGLTYSPDDIVEDETKGILVLRSSNIQNSKLSLHDNVYVEKKIPEELITRAGDILICSRNGSRQLIGKNLCIDDRSKQCTFGAFMTIFRSEHWRYLSKVFNSMIFTSQSGLYLTSTINQLTVNTLNGLIIAIPPTPKEQESIAEHIDERNGEIDNTIFKAEKQIELLQEYRTALISEAVTGKIDVREAV